MTHRLRAAAALSLLFVSLTSFAQSRYRVTRVTDIAGGFDLNSRGDVAGLAFDSAGRQRAALLAEGQVTLLPGLASYEEGRAYGLNLRGEVVGYSMAPIPQAVGVAAHAFYWSRATGTIDLTPETGGASFAYAINDAGEIAGYLMQGPQGGPFVWRVRADRSVEAVRIGEASDRAADAQDINNSGIVVGGHFDFGAFVFDSRSGTLEYLPGFRGWAEAINDRNEVAGYSKLENFQTRAVIWRKAFDGGDWISTDLGMLPEPYNNCYAYDINDAGTAVGQCIVAGLPIGPKAWLWRDGVMTALEDVVADGEGTWRFSNVYAIANDGRILAWGVRDEVASAVILEPCCDVRRRAVRR